MTLATGANNSPAAKPRKILAGNVLVYDEARSVTVVNSEGVSRGMSPNSFVAVSNILEPRVRLTFKLGSPSTAVVPTIRPTIRPTILLPC